LFRICDPAQPEPATFQPATLLRTRPGVIVSVEPREISPTTLPTFGPIRRASLIPGAMSGFRAVNTTLTVTEPPPRLEETTPTTPRPTKFPSNDAPTQDSRSEDVSMKTPTKDSFAGIVGQRPLPTDPPTPVNMQEESQHTTVSRESSHRSTKSLGSSEDVEMGGDKKEGSDNESAQSDGTKPSKKKKGQRFFCTDFPPCQLSFTRSEHLARHIR